MVLLIVLSTVHCNNMDLPSGCKYSWVNKMGVLCLFLAVDFVGMEREKRKDIWLR